jgi:hypothetical protein
MALLLSFTNLPCGIVQGYNWDNPEPDQAPPACSRKFNEPAMSFSIPPTDSQGCEKRPQEKTVNFISFNLFLARTAAKHPCPTQEIKKNRNAKLSI